MARRITLPGVGAEDLFVERKCPRCGERVRWFHEVARANLEELRRHGLVRNGQVKINCPGCRHELWFRFPVIRGFEPFSGGKL